MSTRKGTRARRAAADREWMGQVGHRLRRLRETLGLSQEQVARGARVSQGTVSRLERGCGIVGPFVAMLRVGDTMASRLRAMDPGLLSDSSRRWLGLHRDLATMRGAGVDVPSRVFRDDELEEFVRTFVRLVQTERAIVSAVLKGLAENRATSSDTAAAGASPLP